MQYLIYVNCVCLWIWTCYVFYLFFLYHNRPFYLDPSPFPCTYFWNGLCYLWSDGLSSPYDLPDPDEYPYLSDRPDLSGRSWASCRPDPCGVPFYRLFPSSRPCLSCPTYPCVPPSIFATIYLVYPNVPSYLLFPSSNLFPYPYDRFYLSYPISPEYRDPCLYFICIDFYRLLYLSYAMKDL